MDLSILGEQILMVVKYRKTHRLDVSNLIRRALGKKEEGEDGK